MYHQNEYPTFQSCYCAQCSATRRGAAESPNRYPVEQHDPRYSGVSGLCDGDGIPWLIIVLSPKSAGTPFLNHGQDVGGLPETALIVPDRAQEQLAPWPQTAVSADILLYVRLADILT